MFLLFQSESYRFEFSSILGKDHFYPKNQTKSPYSSTLMLSTSFHTILFLGKKLPPEAEPTF